MAYIQNPNSICNSWQCPIIIAMRIATFQFALHNKGEPPIGMGRLSITVLGPFSMVERDISRAGAVKQI